MLDDLKYIHQRDGQDALGIAGKQWQQYQHQFDFSWKPPRQVQDVVIAGMGGSGLAAKAFKIWPGLEVPLEIVQDYELPDYVHEHTLLIVSSYSGNTEEVLSVLDFAMVEELEPEQRPMVVVIAAGGTLSHFANTEQLPILTLPSGLQPRFTFGYQLAALCTVLEQTSLIGGASQLLAKTGDWLKDQMTNWLPEVPTSQNPAKQIAQELMGKSIVVYSGPQLFPAAYKWKINFNENAKHLAWCNQLPEANHNEILGWTEQPVQKPYAVIDIRSSLDKPRIQKRFEVTDKLLSGKRPTPIVVKPQGETLIQQLLWTIALGDFVSLYLAMLNNINPTPVELIEKLKEALDE